MKMTNVIFVLVLIVCVVFALSGQSRGSEPSIGRYQLAVSTPGEGATGRYLIDTTTGEMWYSSNFTDGEWKPLASPPGTYIWE